jgi:predicted metal-dependent peptidase
MKFSRVIGKIDPKLVSQAEERLSQVFLELGTRYDNEHVGTGLGGDPLIFSLMYPVEHICTMNIPTAATDGKRYYWNPKFILKHSRKGMRIVCGHEAWHAIYMHPSRRGSRNPKLWNIAVDYIVNGTVMEDFKARKKDPAAEFTKNLGRYMPFKTFCEFVKNPFQKIPGFEDVSPGIQDPNAPDPGCTLPGPSEDRELTVQEKRELEKREKGAKFYYADPDLEEDLKRPEKLYDILYNLLPKCPKCGRLGMYQIPGKGKGQKGQKGQQGQGQGEKDQQQDQQNGGQGQGQGQPNDQHDHGDGQPCNCPNHPQNPGQGGGGQGQPGQGQPQGTGDGPCDHCGGGVDIFGLGGTVDDHMDSEESEEKLAKRISDAMEAAKKMAGYVPAALEDELGKLTAPKVTWQDIVRTRLVKARAGNDRNDWTRFRTRPMFSGLLVPKRRSFCAHFGCLLDTSGSMSKDDMAFGLSQLQSLDERSEGTVVPADATIYWDQATKLRKADKEELMKVKVVGRGGTKYAEFFTDYQKNIGDCDFLIVITDGFLLDTDVAEMKHPGVDVIWLITSGSAFNPPFGRAFDLRA